jgi:hypothetical protein
VDELDDVVDDLDTAIRRFRDAVRADDKMFTATQSPALSFMQWAWSEVERRWISMTFHEHQAWLARPDLDPSEFAFHQAAL